MEIYCTYRTYHKGYGKYDARLKIDGHRDVLTGSFPSVRAVKAWAGAIPPT